MTGISLFSLLNSRLALLTTWNILDSRRLRNIKWLQWMLYSAIREQETCVHVCIMALLWGRSSLKLYTRVKKHRFNHVIATKQTKQTAWPESASKLLPTERLPLVGEVSANLFGYRVPRGQRDGSLRSYSRLPRPEQLLFFQVAPQLYPRGWVDSVPDPLLLIKCGSAGNRTRTSGSVARNSDH
jgi:hypothetical protein